MRDRWIGIVVCSSAWLHSRAINLLRNLLSCHDFDQRLTLNDEKSNRNRIARLDLPLIHIISNNITKLFDPGNASFGIINSNHSSHHFSFIFRSIKSSIG